MSKLTKRTVDSAKPDSDRDLILWDDELRGFGLRVKSTGRKTFIVQYRNNQGRSRRMTIGTYGVWTVAQARERALSILHQSSLGKDPVEDKQAEKKVIRVSELAERYLTEHAVPHKKPRSVAEDRRMLEQIILPAIGSQKIGAVTRQDVGKIHHSLRDKPIQANRVLALLSKMFSLAEGWGLRPDGTNPCRHVKRYKERKRERYLSGEELARLGGVLQEIEEKQTHLPSVVTLIRLLILTGARLGEIQTLKWEHVDLDKGVLRLPDSKTGEKTIPLGSAAVQVLENAPHVASNPYVCPGMREGGHLVGVGKIWREIRKQAGIEDVRIHDLRHSFASVGAGAGLGLPILGRLLGHTQAATTQRYAHLADDPLKQAANQITERISSAMRGLTGAKVIPIKPDERAG